MEKLKPQNTPATTEDIGLPRSPLSYIATLQIILDVYLFD